MTDLLRNLRCAFAVIHGANRNFFCAFFDPGSAAILSGIAFLKENSNRTFCLSFIACAHA